MSEKVDVVGGNIDPLFQYLTDEAHKLGTADPVIKWNFTKFLVGKDGRPIKRYAPADKPESLEPDIEAALH